MIMAIVEFPTYPDPVTGKEIPIGSEARGSIAKTRTYQMTTVTIDGDMQNRRRVQQQKAYHAPVQPDSEAQLACRQDFRGGMAAWGALSPEEKEIWNALARLEYENRGDNPGTYRVRSGCNLFMSDYLLTY